MVARTSNLPTIFVPNPTCYNLIWDEDSSKGELGSTSTCWNPRHEEYGADTYYWRETLAARTLPSANSFSTGFLVPPQHAANTPTRESWQPLFLGYLVGQPAEECKKESPRCGGYLAPKTWRIPSTKDSQCQKPYQRYSLVANPYWHDSFGHEALLGSVRREGERGERSLGRKRVYIMNPLIQIYIRCPFMDQRDFLIQIGLKIVI